MIDSSWHHSMIDSSCRSHTHSMTDSSYVSHMHSMTDSSYRSNMHPKLKLINTVPSDDVEGRRKANSGDGIKQKHNEKCSNTYYVIICSNTNTSLYCESHNRAVHIYSKPTQLTKQDSKQSRSGNRQKHNNMQCRSGVCIIDSTEIPQAKMFAMPR